MLNTTGQVYFDPKVPSKILSNLTPEDIYEIRIFEEPLVTVEADPSPTENCTFYYELIF
jgi:hypothetical protein